MGCMTMPKRVKAVKCTECGQWVDLRDIKISKTVVGCTAYGHYATRKLMNYLKKKAKNVIIKKIVNEVNAGVDEANKKLGAKVCGHIRSAVLEDVRQDIKDKTKLDLKDFELMMSIADYARTADYVFVMVALTKVLKQSLDMNKHLIVYTTRVGMGAMLIYRKKGK